MLHIYPFTSLNPSLTSVELSISQTDPLACLQTLRACDLLPPHWFAIFIALAEILFSKLSTWRVATHHSDVDSCYFTSRPSWPPASPIPLLQIFPFLSFIFYFLHLPPWYAIYLTLVWAQNFSCFTHCTISVLCIDIAVY